MKYVLDTDTLIYFLKGDRNVVEALTILEYCEDSSLIFAEQKAVLKKQGTLVADMDLMIASITLRHKATLVTNNTKHFARINGLKLENWSCA